MNAEETTSFYIKLASDRVDDVAAGLDGGLSVDATIRLQEGKPLRPLVVAAAANGAAEVVQLLIERGAQLDARDEEGMTALMHAAKAKHGEVVKALLRGGANRRLTTADGRTASDLTRANSIKELLEASADEASADEASADEASADETQADDGEDEDDGEDSGDDEEDEEAFGERRGPSEMTVAALEAYHDRTLPEALRRFVETRAWEAVEGKTFPMPSYRDGVQVRFAGSDDEGGLEVPGLLEDAGDYDEDAAEDLIPFGAIYLDDDYRDAQFLLVDASKPECPVVMFEHETGQFEPVADSIEAFLATAGQVIEASDEDEDDEDGDDEDDDSDD